MKLTLSQALCTVLNIHQNGEEYYRVNNGIEQPLGKGLHRAIVRAIDNAHWDDECNFAIFPMGTLRGELYMEIERDMLRQEAEIEGPMYEQMSQGDPRELVMMIMEQLRQCAHSVVTPQHFRKHLQQAGSLIIASLQWTDNWITHLRMRQAAMQSKDNVVKLEPLD